MINFIKDYFEFLSILMIISLVFIARFFESSYITYPLIIIFQLIFLVISSSSLKIKDFRLFDSKILFLLLTIFLFFLLTNSFNFYFDKISLFQIMKFLLIFFIFLFFSPIFKNKLSLISLISYAVLCFVLFLIFALYAIDINHPYMANNLNYGVVVMPIIGLINGAEIPISIQSQYGLYPYFFNLLFKLVPFNFYNLNFVFAILFIFSLFSIYFITTNLRINKIVSILTTLSCLSLLTVFGNAWPGELYFQFTPIRVFLPSLSLLIFYFFLKKSISFFVLTILISLGFFWNFDTFIPILMALIIYFLLTDNKLIYKKIILLISIPICYFLIFQLYIYFQTNNFFDILDLFAPQLSFKENSYFNSDNLPLSFIAITNFIFVFYFYFKSKQNILIYNFGFFVSLLNIFLLPYGFKHPAPLALCSFLIPVIFSIYISTKIEHKHSILFKFALIFPLLFLSFIFIDSLKINSIKNYINLPFVNDNYIYPYPTEDFLSTRYQSKTELQENQFIPIWLNKINTINMLKSRNLIKSFDNIFVASERDHLFYYHLKTYNPLKLVNWHHVADYNYWTSIYESLDNAKFEYVITDTSFLYENADFRGRDNFMKFEKKLKNNYLKIFDIHDGYEWYHPGFKKSYTSLYIRK